MPVFEPVPLADVQRALLLLAGGEDFPAARHKASRLESMILGPQAMPCTFWWARTPAGPQAAALVIHNPGRVGMIFHGPFYCHQQSLLGTLLERCSRQALGEGMAFIQAMTDPQATLDAQVFRKAGFEHLAQLIYMQRRLDTLPEPAPRDLTWKTVQEITTEELGQLLLDTYEDSLDCPLLRGLRRPEDIIAGHRASGLYQPASWWIAYQQGRSVGCVLVNVSSTTNINGEVVYMGLRKIFRKQGYARAMLLHALDEAARKGIRVMFLASDSANAPALKLYHQLGFFDLQRREVYIKRPVIGTTCTAG